MLNKNSWLCEAVQSFKFAQCILYQKNIYHEKFSCESCLFV